MTGWRRRSEVLPLTWAQVDFAGGFVRLEPGTTKNSEGRAFPLIPELRALLERRHGSRGAASVPRHAHRPRLPPLRQTIKSLRRAWKTACREAGRPGLLLHDLRRSAVRNLERAGISRAVAMKLTGHKDRGGVPALRDRRRERSPRGGHEAHCRARNNAGVGAAR